jgi:hypothetical protein
MTCRQAALGEVLEERRETNAYWQGFIDGLRECAWVRDGETYVGTCGTTLGEAIDKAVGRRNIALEKLDRRVGIIMK